MSAEAFRSLAQALLGQAAPQPATPDKPFQVVSNQQIAADQLNQLPYSNQGVAERAPYVQQSASQPPPPTPESIKADALRNLAIVNQERAKRGDPPLAAETVAQLGGHAAGTINPTTPQVTPQPEAVEPDVQELDGTYDGVKRDANGVPMSPQALLQEIQEKHKTDVGQSNRLNRMQIKGAADAMKVQKDIENAQQPAEDELHKRIEASYNDLHGVQKEVDEHAANAITEYKAVQSDMMKIAQAKPQDIWGQAGVNKMAGIAAVFFGGFGVNGTHANHNLDRINALADRNIAQQKAQFERLQSVGEGQRTLYGMLQQRLQNSQAVTSTLKNMAQDSYVSQLRTIANKYSDPKWTAEVEKVSAKFYGEKMEREQTYSKTAVDESQNALKLIAADKARKVLQDNFGRKQALVEKTHGIAGYNGFVQSPTEHAKIAEMASGGRSMIEGADNVEASIKHGMSVPEYRALLVNYAIHFSAARKFLQTGTRIEAGEQKVLDSLNVNPDEVILTPPSDADLAGLKTKLDTIRRLITQQVDTTVDTYAHDTMKPDPNDPIFAKWRKRYNGSKGQQTGQSLIDDLQNADGSTPYKQTQVVAGGY